MISIPLKQVYLKLCEDVNSPMAQKARSYVYSGSWLDLVKLKCEPRMYPDAAQYFKDAAVTRFLSKLDVNILPDKLLREECVSRFLATEAQNLRSNIRFSAICDGFPVCDGVDYSALIADIRKRVAAVLGRLPRVDTGNRRPLSNEQAREAFRSGDFHPGFGPGATLTDKSKRATIPDKIENIPTGTASALYIYNTLGLGWAWDVYGGTDRTRGTQLSVRAGRFATVPKDATKLRGIILPPNVNAFLQRGVGKYIRSRLYSQLGIKITGEWFDPVSGLPFNGWVAPDRHSRLAREASYNGTLATIDLSDASNTISKDLVRCLLPDEWYSLLSDLREPCVELPDGRTLVLEMFSAMGNGFTFELETLLFHSIVASVSGVSPDVFGDDIITPTHTAASVLRALSWFGFTPNLQKTFLDGPFRESCGGDFFLGSRVRPHYQKVDPSSPAEWIALVNGLIRSCDGSTERFNLFKRAIEHAINQIPKEARLFGPAELGDLVIDNTFFPDRPAKTRPQRSSDGEFKGLANGITEIKCWAPVQVQLELEQHWKPSVALASALYGVPPRVVPRDSTIGYRTKWVPFS